MECGEEFVGSIPHGGRSGNHFETKHGMTNQEYLEKYPEASIYSDAARWRMRQAERTFPENYSETLRQAQLKRYKRDIVWNKGFCKETHPSLTKLSESQKANALEDDYVNSFQGRTHSEKTKKILSDINKSRQDDYVTVRNWLESVERSAKMGIYLSEPHAVLIQALKDSGLWSEFDFDFERWVTIGRLKHGMDISTVKPFKFAIEVDGCYYHGCPTHTDLNKLPSYARDQINIQMNRDADLDKAYEKDGWILLRLWEHEVKEDLPSCIAKICDILEHKIEFVKSYDDVKSNLSTEISSILTKTTELVLDLSDKPTEEILDYYRHRGFPYYHYTSSKIKQDFESLCKYDTSDMMEGDSLTLVRKGLGMKAPNYFMRNFFSASKNKKPSMLEVFECDDMLKDVIESRKKYAKKGKVSDSTMRTGLRIRASAPSSFPSPLAKYVYERFIDKEGLKVLDPCAGFGGRMIGSQSLPFDVSYTGVDPWTENIENLSIMRDWFGFEKCDLIHSPFEKVRLHDNSFDFAFTSPPHYTKESYTREDTQSIIRYPEYKEWIDKFLKPLIFNTYRYLKPSSHLVLHVSETGDTFVQDCVDLMREAGFTIKDSFYWEIRNFMHKNQSSRKEPFLVGYKES
jgi:G:T-mismatch repair DNA endonuclease (very short patch repair protein)